MNSKMIIALLTAAVLLTGCSGKQNSDESLSEPAPASQTAAESSDPEAEQRRQQETDEAYKKGYQRAVWDIQHQTLRVTGDFTATVQKIIPDYCSDSETPRAAVLTLFQDGPFVVLIKTRFLENLEEGKTYTFVLREQEIAWTNGIWDPENSGVSVKALSNRQIELSEIREPTEEECGNMCDRLHAELVSQAADHTE